MFHECIHFQGSSTTMRPDPFPQDPITLPDNLPSQLHRQYWRAIGTRQSRGNQVQDWYCLKSMDMSEFGTYVEHIQDKTTTVFKLNLSFGFVLFNNETEQMQYHHSSANNNRVFDSPFQIHNENLDVFEWAKQQRPNSKRVVMDIANATFYVTKLRDHPIGRSTRLPKYVLENPAIVSLDCSKQTGLPYKDKLCFFRCLALHRGCHPKNLECDTHHLFEVLGST